LNFHDALRRFDRYSSGGSSDGLDELRKENVHGDSGTADDWQQAYEENVQDRFLTD